MARHFLSFQDLTAGEIEELLSRTSELKEWTSQGRQGSSLQGKAVGLLFEKASTRTRVSFEVGVIQLGGAVVSLNPEDMQIKRGEEIQDTARVLSRYLNALVIRTHEHGRIEEFARYCDIPVINGLTDLLHPCQILADLFTVQEKHGELKGLKIAYVGDGNNVANSWVEAAGRLPFQLTLACPEGYEPDEEILEKNRKTASYDIKVLHDPVAAVQGCDVINTDCWVSMGQEDEYEKRLKTFDLYQVNADLLKHAGPNVVVMHCLPAYRGKEISSEVLEGKHSVVFDQAENRLHVQKALMEKVLE